MKIRAILFTGFFDNYTTFSSYAQVDKALLKTRKYKIAFSNILLSPILQLAAVLLGALAGENIIIFFKKNRMRKEERYNGIIKWFSQNMPVAETELHYKDPFQLLIAVILSAQCTDKRVNMITPALFEAYPTPEVLAAATPEAVFEYIRSVSYPNNKARHLVGMAQKLIEEFAGEIPSEVDQLVKLPGVGRKTANVIASVVFDKPAMAVDTHVFRVSNRIGLTNQSKTPLETEKELVKHIPEQLIPKAHHWLILHGRYVCLARKPKCEACGLKPWCKFFLSNKQAE